MIEPISQVSIIMSDRSLTSPDLRQAMDELDNVCLDAADQQTVLLQRILSQLTTLNFRMERLESDSRALTSNTDLLVERSAPKSNCVFCSVEDNRDNHFSGRCSRFSDPVARTAQAMVLRLCLKCLKPEHGAEDCRMRCGGCGRDHNQLLCSSKPRPQAAAKRPRT
ncbi:hypothetical protein Y032_0629g849 [Ancylostoma ceylanicum]|uniref:Uncharacterized protein n=1 Tax=Ancylostoma ceylanicum TaxID=53326 RepID=A0A016WLG5_9BILA|nr:hypothetical protein Y032_0629g849 [Ancylostoma ceylanicum]